ncbi:MAG: SAM-dependent methyltransferase, partial [Verrucomicrobiota bacterium]|nr:SAM-dependent methyltransferase [Verrucomicrobiota bacterium]
MSEPSCKICNQPLTEVIDFGRQPLGNGFLNPDQFENEYFFPMRVGFSSESMMFQLINQPAPEQMFHENYAFFSGTSKYMDQHFTEFAEQVKSSGHFDNDDPF